MTVGAYNFEPIYRLATVPDRTITIKQGGVAIPYPGAQVVGEIRRSGKTGALIRELPINFAGIGSGSFTIQQFDWTYPAGRYYYDIFLIQNGVKTPILAGYINVTQNVTEIDGN